MDALLDTCYTKIVDVDVAKVKESMRNDIWSQVLNEYQFTELRKNGFKSEYKPSSTAMHFTAYLKQLRMLVAKYNITDSSQLRTLVKNPAEMGQFADENNIPDVASASIAYTLGYYQASKKVRMSGERKRVLAYIPVRDIVILD